MRLGCGSFEQRQIARTNYTYGKSLNEISELINTKDGQEMERNTKFIVLQFSSCSVTLEKNNFTKRSTNLLAIYVKIIS